MNVSASDIWLGFIMTFAAAASTFLGAAASLYFRDVNRRTVALILGFAAGIMLYTAFMKLMPDASAGLVGVWQPSTVKLVLTAMFFTGVLLLYPLGSLVRIWKQREKRRFEAPVVRDRKIAFIVFCSISFHSFVEGMATFLLVLASPWIAVPLLMSVIAHNFPEGMTIGALFNRVRETMGLKRALVYSGMSSLFEPIGAFVAYLFIMHYSSPVLTSLLRAFLAGLIVATALNELIPNSQLDKPRKVSVNSIVAGMFVMALVLVAGAWI